MQVLIGTKRLMLKGVTPSLLHELFQSLSKNEIKSYFGVDDNRYEHYKEMHEKGMETHRLSLFFFLLVEKLSNETIGVCGYHTWSMTHRRAELFYILRDEKFMGKGLMSEAVKEVIKYGFETLHLNRIEALVASWNKASVKLVINNHFKFEGTMRQDYVVNGKSEDSDCYSLLKQEWLSTSNATDPYLKIKPI